MRIGFFITARLKSQRLPKKILLDLNGKTVIDRVIERTRQIRGIDGVVLCTSDHPQDTVLLDYAKKNKIEFFTGSQEDVLKRLLDAANNFNYDAFLSITADNPLFSIVISQKIADLYKKQRHDFIYTRGLPMGCGTYVIDVKALQVVNYIKKQSNTEIWGPFINRPDFFNVGELEVTNSPFKENLRITLDYEEDYLFLSSLYNRFDQDHIPSLKEIFNTLEKNPEFLEINKDRIQATLDEDILSDINAHFQSAREETETYARHKNIDLVPGFTKYRFNI